MIESSEEEKFGSKGRNLVDFGGNFDEIEDFKF